jgi:MFS family permease
MTANDAVDAPAFAGGRLTPGWQALVICFLMATFAWGVVFYGHSVYLNGLQQYRGWSSSLISTAILVFWLCTIPATLVVGQIVDRYGPVPIVVGGALCIGLGAGLLGQVTAPWQLFIVYAAMGFGYPALGTAGISAALAPWFDRRFGFALGLALTGASLGGAVLPPMMVAIMVRAGFGTAMAVVGAITLGILLPAAAMMVRANRRADRTGDRAAPASTSVRPSDVLRRPLFWRIAIGGALGLGAQVGFLAHQIPVLVGDLGAEGAAAAVAVVAISAAVGRIAVGVLSRHVTESKLTAASYLTQATGYLILVLAGGQVIPLYFGCAVAGFVVGAIVMLPPILVRHAFGTAGYGRIYSMVAVALYSGAGIGPWLAGISRDLTGSYALALWILIGMHVVAAGFFITLRLRRAGPA